MEVSSHALALDRVGGIHFQAAAFTNLTEVVSAAGGTFSDVVKFTLFVTDMAQFGLVNAVMKEYVKDPYPARSCVEVSSLPKGALFEVEAIAVIKEMSF